LLKQAKQGGVKVLWVPIRDSAYKQTALKNYQPALSPDTPLAAMTTAKRDRAWEDICDAIEAAINSSRESHPNNFASGGAEISAVREQMLMLANKYEDIRRTMLAGDNRTHNLETVASQMRSLALPAYRLLGNLIGSESSGQQLAAVSILEAIPNPAYLLWLADRIAMEKPFIAYHAAVALLNAARSLSASNRDKVQEAIHQARQNLDRMSWKDPTLIAVLRCAQEELNKE
jgi:hypothetical protein